jgi:hypothetical protein
MQIELIQTQTDPKLRNKLTFDWLANNPHRWRGKQVLSRRTGQFYTVREVMPGGRVELERKWVLYSSDVQTIRRDYEPASP